MFSAGAQPCVSHVVAEGLLPGGWRWVVAESGKLVVWIPMGHPGRSRTLLWYRMSQGWLKGMAKSSSCPGPDMSDKGGSAVPWLPPGSSDHLSASAPDSLRES